MGNRINMNSGSAGIVKFFISGVALLASLLGSFNTMAQNDQLSINSKMNTVKAEWEKQEAVWTIWPTDTSMQEVISESLFALTKECVVNLVVNSDSLRDFALLALKNKNIDFGRIKIIVYSKAKGFIRDHGPWFLFDANGQPARTGFKWNNFGVPISLTRNLTKKDSVAMGSFAGELTAKMKLKTISSELVIENGMIEMNSKGIAICFMETVLQRNPGFDLPFITNELKRVLGLKKILLLGSAPTMDKLNTSAKASNIFGYGANGHIDQYVRFANDSTILIAQFDPVERRFDPVSSADYFILKDNLEYLKKFTDENDRPFNIIEMPIPAMRFHLKEDTIQDIASDTVLFKGFENGVIIYHAPIVSYLNFFICNNTVIVPEYFNDKLTDAEKLKDEQVGEIFSKLFPDKKIVRINPLPLNFKGGGIRRSFISQPEGISLLR